MHLQVRGPGHGPGEVVARIGVFGGTFNPPHVGHLICAQEAHWQLGLEQVMLVPAGQPPHKPVEGEVGPEVRYELCLAAVEGEGRFAVSRAEVEKQAPAYTHETLAALQAERQGDELVFVMGADQAADLPGWRDPAAVLRLARVAVVERGGLRREQIRERLAQVPGGEEAEFFDMPAVEVSSTLVRERAAAGRPIRYLVPDAVADLIEQRGLYG